MVYILQSRDQQSFWAFPSTERKEDHSGPHCCGHCFTIYVRKAAMPKEFIQEIRSYVRNDAIDIHDPFDKKEPKEKQLGV